MLNDVEQEACPMVRFEHEAPRWVGQRLGCSNWVKSSSLDLQSMGSSVCVSVLR